MSQTASERPRAGRYGDGPDRSLPSPVRETPDEIGRFLIRGRLGSGTFADVYRAYDPILERDVALKVMRAGATPGTRGLGRFLGEAKTLAKLRHPKVVPIFEVGDSGGTHFMATAFIDGPTLEGRLADGPIEPADAAGIAADLAEALAHAHRIGIAHRDVKPSNVLIARDGATYLTDFGLAHHSDHSRTATAGALIGTPAYLAPEQPTAETIVELALSDQYSLGVVLYQMLCGRVPFLGPPQLVVYSARHDDPDAPRLHRHDVPRSLEAICRKAMSRRPAGRYEGCDQLAADLRGWLALGISLPSDRPAGHLGRAVSWLRGRGSVAAALGLAAVIVGTRSAVSRTS